MKNDTLTAVPGIRVGHAHDRQALTGCTVILCDGGATGGVDVRGSAAGTRELAPLDPAHLVPQVHAVLLTGGSAFGLDAAGGVQRYLEERGIGFETGVARVPIVPAAVLFDLRVGDPKVRPGPEMGYRACVNASEDPVPQGRVGAGMGATAGKVAGPDLTGWGGLGSAAERLNDGLIVGALAVVNAFGAVFDPASGEVLAGTRDRSRWVPLPIPSSSSWPLLPENTTLAVVATNGRLTKLQAAKVAQMAQDGLARCLEPAHTTVDGDVCFALSVGDLPCQVDLVGAVAAELALKAILRAVRRANP